MASSDEILCVVKLEAAAHYVAQYEADFDAIVGSLAIQTAPPQIKLPDGFRRTVERQPDRYLITPDSNDPVTIIVEWFESGTRLNIGAESFGSVINQYRRKLNLPEWKSGWVAQAKEEEALTVDEANGVDWYRFDFAGHADPFRRLNAYKPLGAGGVDYAAPEGWTEKPADAFRLAIFEKEIEGETVTLTVSKAGGTVRANVDRWRRQVGLDPLGGDDPPGETVTIGQYEGVSMLAAGDEKAIRGVIVPVDGGQLLFLKLTGPPAAVDAVESEFQTFVQSVDLG